MKYLKPLQKHLGLVLVFHYLFQSLVAAYTESSAENTWWRHQMETFSALLALCAGNAPVTGWFPSQRPVTRNFDVFFDLRLNEWLSKQSWGWWFETPSGSLWRHCNETWSLFALILLYHTLRCYFLSQSHVIITLWHGNTCGLIALCEKAVKQTIELQVVWDTMMLCGCGEFIMDPDCDLLMSGDAYMHQ